MNLPVYEIFRSIEGETTAAGFTAVFIRTAGCNLNCLYCDTPNAREGGTELSIPVILKKVERLMPAHHITVTGGEPVIHGAVYPLLERLADAGYLTRLETNGSIPLNRVNRKIQKIIDIKTPSSGEQDSFIPENLEFINTGDEIKFVIGDKNDYRFASDIILNKLGNCPAVLNLSPVHGVFDPSLLAEMIINDRLPVRFNLQIHKFAGFR